MSGRTAIAVAGNLVIDTVKRIPSWPNKLELINILDIGKTLGGLVCNVGIALARLDPQQPVLAVGYIGDDANGDLVRHEFARYPSIDTSCLWQSGITSFTDVMTIASTGERTFFTYKGADGLLTPEDMRCVPLERCCLLHIGYCLLLDGMDAPDDVYDTQMARALAEARDRGVETSLDVVSQSDGNFRDIVPPALKYVDYLTINEFEAAHITGIDLSASRICIDDLKRALDVLRAMGVRKRAVIHMPQIAVGLDEDDRFIAAPTLELPNGFIHGSVGAGDAFAAGFLYQTVHGAPLEDALRAGNAVAACSLSAPGSTEGIPTINEALALYDRFAVRKR